MCNQNTLKIFTRKEEKVKPNFKWTSHPKTKETHKSKWNGIFDCQIFVNEHTENRKNGQIAARPSSAVA